VPPSPRRVRPELTGSISAKGERSGLSGEVRRASTKVTINGLAFIGVVAGLVLSVWRPGEVHAGTVGEEGNVIPRLE
jgi:hypothetical protein